MNQCMGCQAGWGFETRRRYDSLIEYRVHPVPDGYSWETVVCTSDRYAPRKNMLEFVRSIERETDTIARLELDATHVTFDNLALISEAFGTRDINFERVFTEGSSGCSTCNFYYDVAVVMVSNITTWPDTE